MPQHVSSMAVPFVGGRPWEPKKTQKFGKGSCLRRGAFSVLLRKPQRKKHTQNVPAASLLGGQLSPAQAGTPKPSSFELREGFVS